MPISPQSLSLFPKTKFAVSLLVTRNMFTLSSLTAVAEDWLHVGHPRGSDVPSCSWHQSVCRCSRDVAREGACRRGEDRPCLGCIRQTLEAPVGQSGVPG